MRAAYGTSSYSFTNILKINIIVVSIFIDFYLELTDAYSQIGFVEAVGDVPSERTEFSSFLNESVEEAESEKQSFPNLYKNQYDIREKSQIFKHRFFSRATGEKFGRRNGIT